MRISDWSSDVCSSDLGFDQLVVIETPQRANADIFLRFYNADGGESAACGNGTRCVAGSLMQEMGRDDLVVETAAGVLTAWQRSNRSEEHTSELQSLMRISYAVFCLKKKIKNTKVIDINNDP